MDNKKLAVFAVLGILIILGAQMALAQPANQTNQTQQQQQAQAQVDEIGPTVQRVICRIINIFYAVAAAIAVLVVVLAGIKWMASGDDPGARKSAKDSVIHAIVGLIIVIIAGALIGWIVQGSVIAAFQCVRL